MADTLPVVDLTNLTFRIDPEMRQWIEDRANAQDRSVAYVLRAMLVKARAAIEEEERGDADDAARS